MTDLTEQWRKGELPAKDDKHQWLAYYIKHKDGHIHADSRFMGQWGIADSDSIEQILAPVPSYDELQSMNEAVNQAMSANIKLVEQNKQLKELLKEIRRKIKTVYDMDLNQFITSAAFTDDFVKKIDEVLNA